jgi:hypothetical protein
MLMCWRGLLRYIPLHFRVIYKYNFVGYDPLVISCVSVGYPSYMF